MRILKYSFILCFMMIVSCKPAQKKITKDANNKMTEKKYGNILDSLLQTNPKLFGNIINNRDSLRVQVIYTQINRDRNNNPSFTDYSFNLNKNLYFYPASTVKMPIALLALEKLNNMNLPGIDKFTPMVTDSSNTGQTHQITQPLALNSAASVSNYIKQIFLVSDNTAFNRLYEFLGPQYIKEQLAAKGYPETEIRHRLQIALTDEQNRQTNAIDFLDTSGNLLYHQPPKYSTAKYSERNNLLGKGYINNIETVMEPFNFSIKNRIYLEDLHQILLSVLFPEGVDEKQRFNLTPDDYKFVYRYMSAYPYESSFPNYDTAEYYDTYVKFLLYGSEKVNPKPHIRIFNKVGDAYGFLTDIAYVADFENKTEFMLSATIFCNSDGIFNDDKYDYDSVGYPFMKNLGQVIYGYELQRKKEYLPELNRFMVDYTTEYP